LSAAYGGGGASVAFVVLKDSIPCPINGFSVCVGPFNFKIPDWTRGVFQWFYLNIPVGACFNPCYIRTRVRNAPFDFHACGNR